MLKLNRESLSNNATNYFILEVNIIYFGGNNEKQINYIDDYAIIPHF